MDQRFQKLVAFKQEHRDISDTSSSNNAQMDAWIPMQHSNDSNLRTDRQGAMNSIGVAW